ncbi:MAG: hypothetical protein ACLFNK_03955 [Candidatus Woesearchaeota archaeon]
MPKFIMLNDQFMQERKDTIMVAIRTGVSNVLDNYRQNHPDVIVLAFNTLTTEDIIKNAWEDMLEKAKNPTEVSRDWFIRRAEVVAFCMIEKECSEGKKSAIEGTV